MPKKFVGENSKAAAARERKNATKEEENTRKQKEKEDAYWADDDKNTARKAARREEEERKRAEAAKRKEENKRAHDEEMATLQGKAAAAAAKVTVASIEARKEAEKRLAKEQEEERKLAAQKIQMPAAEIEENVNVREAEVASARNVEEAISVLGAAAGGGGPEVDKHPEKRLKAAYEAFAEVNLPRLKQDHPTLRLSQLKQLLKKEWQKSPENPLNAKLMSLSLS